jgi:acetyl esterase/lipase
MTHWWLMGLLTGALLGVSSAAEIRRIALDGTIGTAPAEEASAKDGLSRIKKLELPVFELFPAAVRPTKGTVMVCPGGGYGGLAVQHEGRDVATRLNAAGWDAVVLLYHVSAGERTRELALADAVAALRLLQTRGAEFGLATDRIGAMGFSAGGHLCARLAHETATDHPPVFVGLMYPAYLNAGDAVLEEVHPGKSPAFVYVAEDDKYAPGSFAYAAACAEAKVRCEFIHPSEGGHGFGLKPGRAEAVQDWPERLIAFLASLP